MYKCNHLAWFRLSGRGGFCLHDGNRTTQVIQELPNPTKQYPSTVLLLGKKDKDVALREIFPQNNIGKGHCDGIINLRLDNSTIELQYPVLFADGDLSCPIPEQLSGPPCHPNETVPITWKAPPGCTTLDVLYARFVCLFVDVVCLFADDMGGMESVANRLVTWANISSASSLPIETRPRIVIVAPTDSACVTHSLLEQEDLRDILRQQDTNLIKNAFSSIILIRLAGDHISSLARHRRLREVILQEIDVIRIKKLEERCLFSATHYKAFFDLALRHTAKTTLQRFDFVRGSRIGNIIQDDYHYHLSSFLRLGYKMKYSYDSIARFIASSIIMDAYPPRMHLFDPKSVFRLLYRQQCLLALQKSYESRTLAVYQCECIEHQVEEMFAAVESGSEISSQLHTTNVQAQSQQWVHFKSNQTCLFCLRRKPEHILTCGHALCEVCIKIIGIAQPGRELHFQISSCVLCVTQGSLIARLKPATAGCRILSIDGGGIRGVVPLEFLNLLQKLIDCPLQDLFDLAIGTSSGGLIVMDLFLHHRAVAESCRVFDDLARKIFYKPTTLTSSLLDRLKEYIRCWLSDGCYDVAALESSLQETFGTRRRMFDIEPSAISGMKVGVTATTISDARTFLFCNYNGVAIRQSGCGYKLIRPDNPEDEPLVWEAGRSTSAAPGLFSPARIPALGTFQDGGLQHNNPTNLALCESRQIWASDVIPDIVLSLGTGTEDDLKSPKAPHYRHLLNDGFIPRLFRSFMSSMDGERAWKELHNRLDESMRADFFRFNIPLIGPEPQLDDVKQMDDLRKCVQLQPRGRKDRTGTAAALLTATFYFELQSIPTFDAGIFLCQGSIRCRNDFRAVLNSLKALDDSQHGFVTDNEFMGDLDDSDICKACHVYCKVISFYVRHLDERVVIYLNSEKHGRRKISGFATTMRRCVKEQRLDAAFGTPDHDIPGGLQCRACSGISGGPIMVSKRKYDRRETESRKKPRLALGTSL